jgi:hypothetical protein
MGRDGAVTGHIARIDATGILVRRLDGSERLITRSQVDGLQERRIEQAQIDEDAARHGWKRDAGGEWVREDGTVMRALGIPGSWGELGWYRFDPDTGEPPGLDRKCEMGPLTVEDAPALPCPAYPNRCPAQSHRARRVGDGWAVVCPNSGGVAWKTDADLARGAVHPDSAPETALYPPGQAAAPEARTTGWGIGRIR